MKNEEIYKLGSLAEAITYANENDITVIFQPHPRPVGGIVIRCRVNYVSERELKMHLGLNYINMVQYHLEIAVLNTVKYLLGEINKLLDSKEGRENGIRF